MVFGEGMRVQMSTNQNTKRSQAKKEENEEQHFEHEDPQVRREIRSKERRL